MNRATAGQSTRLFSPVGAGKKKRPPTPPLWSIFLTRDLIVAAMVLVAMVGLEEGAVAAVGVEAAQITVWQPPLDLLRFLPHPHRRRHLRLQRLRPLRVVHFES